MYGVTLSSRSPAIAPSSPACGWESTAQPPGRSWRKVPCRQPGAGWPASERRIDPLDGGELARRQPGQLAELGIHVRLVVVAGGQGDVDQRPAARLEERRGPAEAHDTGVEIGRATELCAERGHQAGLRPPGLLAQPGDRHCTAVALDLRRTPGTFSSHTTGSRE